MIGLISTPKIVFARNGYVNKRGESLISIEIKQGPKRILISTNQYIKKENWKNGQVCFKSDKEKEVKMNSFLYSLATRISNIYYERYFYGQDITLSQLVEIIKNNESRQALLEDFGRAIVENSDRKDVTKYGYETLFNDLRKFRQNTTVSDVDYNFIKSYEQYLKNNNLKENTIIGRMQQLRAIMNEAVNRNIIPINPFKRYKISSMKNKQGFLTNEEISKIEKLNLKGKEKVAQKAFLVGCYTGLRFSDIKSLKNSEIKNGWIIKEMKKTGKTVEIPYIELFDGKFSNILNEYGGDIEKLTNKIGENGSLNQTLKIVFEKAGIDPNEKSFHISRHSCASNLLEQGLDENVIKKILGHTKLATTEIYAETTKNVILNNIKKTKQKKKK